MGDVSITMLFLVGEDVEMLYYGCNDMWGDYNYRTGSVVVGLN